MQVNVYVHRLCPYGKYTGRKSTKERKWMCWLQVGEVASLMSRISVLFDEPTWSKAEHVQEPGIALLQEQCHNK